MKTPSLRATLAVAGLLLTALAGCSTKADTVSTAPASTDVATTTSRATTDTPTTAAGTPTPGNAQLAFGQTYTWPDGTTMTISNPEEFTPSEQAVGVEAGWPTEKFTVTWINHAGKSVSSSYLSIDVLSGGRPGSIIISSNENISTWEGTDIPDGKRLEFVVAYSVADPQDIAMTVSPDSGDAYPEVVFVR